MQKHEPVRNGVRYLTISEDQAGQRIDNFLLRWAPRVPKSHIYRIIRTGQVRVNSGRVKAVYKLKMDDVVRIPPITQTDGDSVVVPDAVIKLLEASIVHEDDLMLVINKPPGLAVHAGSGLHFGVIDALRQSRSHAETRLELAHRLDRGTSGCLIIGKSRRSAVRLQDLFRQDRVIKQYRALTVGHWSANAHRVDKPLLKNEASGGERRVHVAPDGKRAVSYFNTRELLAHDKLRATSMDIRIETGRTHQIRVHAVSEGHAIVGDEKYGGSGDIQRFRQAGLKRLFLHCHEMILDMGDGVSVVAQTDKDWQAGLNLLGSSLD